jgi:hypothetical protein
MPKKGERGARPQGVVPLLSEGRLFRAALILSGRSGENPRRGREVRACRRSAGRPTQCTKRRTSTSRENVAVLAVPQRDRV